MVVSFSTLFYMDIPLAALSTLSFYLILKKRYVAAGITSGLMYLTKFNAAFFFPGFLLVILWNERRNVWNLLMRLGFFIVPIVLIYLPDLYWRQVHITSQMDIIGWNYVSFRLSLALTGARWKEYLNSYFTNPLDLVKYFGFAILFLFIFQFFSKNKWNRKSLIYVVPIVSYLLSYLFVFGTNSDIRYLIPILPLLAVLITPSFFSLGKPLRVIFIGVCILQFLGATYYVHRERRLLPEVKNGLDYVRDHVPQNALILYPEENLLIYGQRRVIWSAVKDEASEKNGLRKGLYSLFWGADDDTMNHLLLTNGVSHILIKKSRIYDDRKERHTGGYPQSFVERLPHLEGWKKMFENSGVALWGRTS
jgi:hypothetical protein